MYHTEEQKKAAAYEAKKRQLQRAREFVADYKSKHPCEHCGESHVGCLTFHHVDRDDKTGDIPALMRYGVKRVKAEIAKCIVLCANCHMKLHWEEHRE
jgi:transcription elongation factor Elf1